MTAAERIDAGILNTAHRQRTICEVLREINDLHQGPEVQDLRTRVLLKEAHDMAKRMARKLYEYNKEAFAGWWAENPDYEADLRRRTEPGYQL